MALVRTEGIVLKTHALGDTSRIAVVYTRDLGLVKVVAKGARKSGRFGYALEPLTRSRIVIYHKPDRDLHLLSQAETVFAAGSHLVEIFRLAHAQAALELIDRLVWGEESHPELFDLFAQILEQMASLPLAALPAATAAFELRVASMLGYCPRLDACAGCAGPVSQRRVFSPSRGGLLCDACARIEPGSVRMSADALAGLSLLLSRPVTEASDYVEIRSSGEILRVIEAFLRHHFQRFQGLRSLEILRSLPHDPAPAVAGETLEPVGGAPQPAPARTDDPCRL